ncbi:UDP-N-acetylmuramate--L-alanine ligase [Bdellovibrio sp. 22V]|uniref:UDP-N-acetylmuramate--L-alanine ligase n=1 Tax=Bdellovibrio TaxID=958 RepID=UPI0025439FD4|nr:UDP-N-acetylmuramate--L-alanine ligase [Bdellovibrio sp. 22V]WII72826.1 UDP-N-acetylmuramate--L-alanine ligase [Bdellovibrio sp. 22V]
MKLQYAKFHFVGIGGIGMCGLAELLHNIGAKVTGSDLADNANTERLKEMGVKIFKGHAASNVGEADVVVYSSAIQYGNPEISEARARQIPLIPRAEALAEIMRLKRGVAVAGTHGKTTTTSMTSAIFLEANLSPTIMVGGRFELIKSTALLGTGDWLVAEADESDGSFHKLSPEIAIITNVDSDHLDHFKTFENLQKNFYDFALKVPFYGKVIACGDDPVIRQIFENFPKRILFYGFDEKNDLVLSGEQGKYSLYRSDRLLGTKHLVGEFSLKVPGRHNALNAVAAICAGVAAGIPFATCAKGLQRFEGVDRRFHFKGEKRGIKVYDDYGHHPTEVRAVLQAFREKYPNQRLVVFFQPHRFTRTQHCWHDFTTAFKEADEVLLTDIYPAGEAPIPGVSSMQLAQEMKHERAQYFTRDDKSAQRILGLLKEGDVFVTLGAGDGWKLGLDVLNAL